MSLKAEATRADHSDLLIWLLIGSLLAAVYYLIPTHRLSDDAQTPALRPDLRAQAETVSRQLLQLSDTNDASINSASLKDVKGRRMDILNRASSEVMSGQQAQLVARLLELGELSITSLDLADAELYLQEALALAIDLQAPELMADSYRLLGHLNIKKRNLARRSAHAYDALLVVRNRIALGQFNNTQHILQTVINDNLEIRRYGSAAAAWVTMASYHEKQNDFYQANIAKIEAARLFAQTGGILRARRLLDSLSVAEIDEYSRQAITQEIEAFDQQYQADQNTVAMARDLRRLFNLYRERGDTAQAWQYRIRANELLLKANDQLMFERLPDVVAVLYKSNTAVDQAGHYLQRAERLYAAEGMQDRLEQIRAMQQLVF